MKNDGKEAERGFVAYWERVGHVQRFRDMKDLMGINKGARIKDFPKPADFLVSSPDTPLHYAEVKSTLDAKNFTFNKIRPGQSHAAQKEYLSGSNAYKFYIFSYPLGKWYVMDCATYAHCLKTGRKSISFEELPLWNQ